MGGWLTPHCSLLFGSLAVMLSKRQWNGTRGLESVEATLDGRLTNTWQITDLIKLVTAPWTPINTPSPSDGIQHTTLYL
jgi:hypothetical protein